MKNIWFIRTDKDDCDQLDVTEQNPFIYSLHGSCSDHSYITNHKDKIFPELVLGKEDLKALILLIKKELIADGVIDVNDDSKEKCGLVIHYWLAVMGIGDIVFVRNKQQKVLVCEVTGYVSESFFNTNGSFQRPVKVLHCLTKESGYEKIWKRTLGRKTIERNGQDSIKKLVLDLLKKIKP